MQLSRFDCITWANPKITPNLMSLVNHSHETIQIFRNRYLNFKLVLGASDQHVFWMHSLLFFYIDKLKVWKLCKFVCPQFRMTQCNVSVIIFIIELYFSECVEMLFEVRYFPKYNRWVAVISVFKENWNYVPVLSFKCHITDAKFVT